MSELIKLSDQVTVQVESNDPTGFAAALSSGGPDDLTSSSCGYTGAAGTAFVWQDNGDGTGYFEAVPIGEEGGYVCTSPAELSSSSSGTPVYNSTGSLVLYLVDEPATPPPTEVTVDVPIIGWNAAAVSAAPLTGDGGLLFQIPAAVAGVICGLTRPEMNSGTGYADIQWGIHCQFGTYRIVEAGEGKTGATAYTGSTEFKILRHGQTIKYLADDVLVYTSLVTTNDPYLITDCSLFMSGDSVSSIEYIDTAYAFATLPGLSSKASEDAYADVDAVLPGLEGASTGLAQGSVAATLPGLVGKSANATGYADVDATLPGLTVLAGGGLFEPTYAWSSGILPNLWGYSWDPTVVDAQVDATLPGLTGKSSESIYGEVDATLPGLEGWAQEFWTLPGYASLVFPPFEIQARGGTDYASAELEFPEFAITAYGAGSAYLTFPPFEITASGTAPQIGRGTLVFPPFEITASGKTGRVGTGELEYDPQWAITSYSGGYAELEFPPFAMSAEGATGNVGSAYLEFPLFAITASGTVENFGRAYLEFPEFACLHGSAELVFPAFVIQATGSQGQTLYYSAYSINLANNALTEHEGQPFLRVIKFQGEYYGLTATDMYLIGNRDDHGTPISASAKVSASDLGTSRQKRIRLLSFGSRGTDPIKGRVYFDGQFISNFVSQQYSGVGTRRAKLGKGTVGRYFSYSIQNIDGGDLDLFSAEYEPQILRRSF